MFTPKSWRYSVILSHTYFLIVVQSDSMRAKTLFPYEVKTAIILCQRGRKVFSFPFVRIPLVGLRFQSTLAFEPYSCPPTLYRKESSAHLGCLVCVTSPLICIYSFQQVGGVFLFDFWISIFYSILFTNQKPTTQLITQILLIIILSFIVIAKEHRTQ